MEENYAKSLLAKYAAGQCTPEEIAIVETWYLQQKHEGVKHLKEKERAADMQEVRSLLISEINQDQKPVRRLWPRIAAAASVILLLSAGTYFLINRNKAVPDQYAHNDIAPATQQAILKIRGHKAITLGNAKTGLIAMQANIQISKTGEGTISYQNTGNAEAAPIYDTIQIPAGGRSYELKLADGSKVLLNAATTFRFPETFSNKERPSVELITGEAYFEIVHNEKAPLQIHIPHQVIEDIGTKFNISAYPDDADARTTLAEGAVKVTAGNSSRKPLPGEQAIYANNKLTVAPANLTKVLAWTNGYFRFYDESITDVMKELARWYNIEVVYQGPVTKERFNGKISRFKNISAVLRVLERTKGVHFKIDGRRVTVLNKP